MSTTSYTVPDMSCAHCKARIEKEVNGLDGIQSANVELADKLLIVDFDESKVDAAAIEAAVAEAGYTAQAR
ncbi:copper resistance protein CopZ [Aerococcus sp. 1KP-2016]|nr:copper resistance protein CopZ [Aerococcus sp. 1KP-2016]